MNVNADEVFSKIIEAAEGAFKANWQIVRTFAPAEFKKMAIQLAEIVENVSLFEVDNTQGYSPETAKVLFSMQRVSCEAVLVALTQLTLVTVQDALNGITIVLRNTFEGIIAAVV